MCPTSNQPDSALPARRWLRVHVSTWVLLSLLAVPLVLISVPGEIRLADNYDEYRYGWPLVYRVDQDPVQNLFDLRNEAPWTLADAWQLHAEGIWYPWALVVDLISCCAILFIASVGWQWWLRQRKRWYQFGLKEMLLATIVFAALWGYAGVGYVRENRIVAHLSEEMGEPNEPNPTGRQFSIQKEYHGPRWLAKLVGTRRLPFFDRVTYCEIECDNPAFIRDRLNELSGLHHLYGLSLDDQGFKGESITDKNLEIIGSFSQLHSLALRGHGITDAGIVCLESLTRLTDLDVTSTSVTDIGLRALLAKNSKLRTTPSLRQASITAIQAMGGDAVGTHTNAIPDHGFALVEIKDVDGADLHLERLREFPRLQRLYLRNLELTSEDLADVANCHELVELVFQNIRHKNVRRRATSLIDIAFVTEMTKLQLLDLKGTQVGDAGLVNIARLDLLGSLNLASTGVTDAGLVRLQSLPVLRELRLYHNALSDDAAAVLEQFSDLDRLYLDSSQLSPLVVSGLRRSLPQCKISVIQP
jgi:Leucine-rich repeat (LRR) protein